jgi:hypothetical protein
MKTHLIYALVWLSSLALFSALVIMIGNMDLANAESYETYLPKDRTNLFTKTLYLERNWQGGFVRAKLVGDQTIPDDWQINLNYDGNSQIVLTASNAGARIVDKIQSNQIVLDLPVVPGTNLSATTTKEGLCLNVIAVVFNSHVNSQQQINNLNIELFDKKVGNWERSMGPSFGRLDLLGERGTALGVCSAFRVAKKYWVSAAHCVAQQESGSAVVKWRVQPFDYSDKEGMTLYWASPIATGQDGGKPDTKKPLLPTDLDYALFLVDTDPGGPRLDFMETEIVVPGDELQLFQHWAGTFGPLSGKARSADDDCRVFNRIGRDHINYPDLCPKGIQHGCDSTQQSSGGAVISRKSGKLVAIHIAGGRPGLFNCALPVATVLRDLCEKQPTIAKEIALCP